MDFVLRYAIFDQGSNARNGQYLAHAKGNKHLAAALYEWNAELTASFSKDLAFVEINLRQRIDTALREWNRRGEPGATWRWIKHPRGDLAALVPQKKRKFLRSSAIKARSKRDPSHPRKNYEISHDDLIAQMTFGDWKQFLPHTKNVSRSEPRYQQRLLNEQNLGRIRDTLWRANISDSFPNVQNDPNGHGVFDRVARIHALRNRVAHAENLLTVNVPARFNDMVQLLNAMEPSLRDHFEATSTTPRLSNLRPPTQ